MVRRVGRLARGDAALQELVQVTKLRNAPRSRSHAGHRALHLGMSQALWVSEHLPAAVQADQHV